MRARYFTPFLLGCLGATGGFLALTNQMEVRQALFDVKAFAIKSELQKLQDELKSVSFRSYCFF